MEKTSLAERPNQSLAALTPSATLEAQTGIIAWCEHKIHDIDTRRAEAIENYEQAKKGKFKSSPFLALAKRLEKERTYYEKIIEAVRRGYVVIPNFACQAFAVRVTGKVKGVTTTARWRADFEQRPRSLAEGEGEWVNPFPFIETWTEEGDDGKKVTHHRPTEHDTEIAFPVVAVKPALLTRAQEVMADKLFDDIAVTTEGQPGRDPILVGRISHPTRKRGYGAPQVVTFFLGWWFDLEDL